MALLPAVLRDWLAFFMCKLATKSNYPGRVLDPDRDHRRSMKVHVKQAIETIEALGFEDRARDADRQSGNRLYRHPWYPDESPIRLHDTAARIQCRVAEDIAFAIVKMQPPLMSSTIVLSRHMEQRERAEREARDRLAGEIRRRLYARECDGRASACRARNERDDPRFYERLMQPGYRCGDHRS